MKKIVDVVKDHIGRDFKVLGYSIVTHQGDIDRIVRVKESKIKPFIEGLRLISKDVEHGFFQSEKERILFINVEQKYILIHFTKETRIGYILLLAKSLRDDILLQIKKIQPTTEESLEKRTDEEKISSPLSKVSLDPPVVKKVDSGTTQRSKTPEKIPKLEDSFKRIPSPSNKFVDLWDDFSNSSMNNKFGEWALEVLSHIDGVSDISEIISRIPHLSNTKVYDVIVEAIKEGYLKLK